MTYAKADEFAAKVPMGSRNFSMPPFALRPRVFMELSSRRKKSIMRGKRRKRTST